MKKFLAALLILILLGSASLIYFVAKSFNAPAYQQQIIQTVSELTGRKFMVSGQTSVKWLPMPTIVLTGVYITNQGGSDRANMITADTVKIQIEWSSLMTTPLVVKSIELVKPTLYLERLESNRANWDIPLFSAPDENINDTNLITGTSAIGNTKIDQVSIKNGSIFYVNKITKQSAELKNINGDLSLESLKGPYKFDGSAHMGKDILSAAFTIGKIRNDTPAAISAKIQEKSSGLSIDFNGTITKNDPKSLFNGDGSFTLKKPKSLLEKFGINVPENITAQSAVGNFTLESTPLIDTLKNFVIRFGNDDSAFAMTTTLAYAYETKTTPAKLDGEVAFNTLDTSMIVPYIKSLGWNIFQKENTYPALNLKVNISDLKVGENTLKGTQANVSYADNTLNISEGKTILPGSMATDFSINSGQTNGTPYLLFFAKGKTTAVKPLFVFLNIDKYLPMTDKIKSLDADVRVTIAPNFMSVFLNGIGIDAATIKGSIDFSTNQKKTFSVNLDVNNLNVDTYTGWKPEAEKTPLSALPAVIQKTITSATDLTDMTATVKVNFAALTWHNLPMTTASLNAVIKDGTLTINTAEFEQAATASARASATLSSIGTPAAALQELSFIFNAEQLPLFLERTGLTSELPLLTRASKTQIAGTISGSNSVWKTNIMAALSEAEIKLKGTLSFSNNFVNFQDFNFNIIHPNFQKFLGLVNLQPGFFKNLDGTLRSNGILNGSNKDLKLTQFDTSVGTQRISGTATYIQSGGQKITADLTSPALDLDRFIPSQNMFFENAKPSTKSFDFSAFNDWDVALRLNTGRLTYKTIDLSNAAANISLKDKTFSITDFTGSSRTNNAPFRADGSLTWATEPTLKMNINAPDVTIRPDFFIVNKFSYGGGKVSINGNFLAAGNSPSALIASLGGSGNATFTGGSFIGMDLGKIDSLIKKTMTEGSSQDSFDTALTRLMQLGKTPVSSLSGAYTITKGVVRFMDMTVQTPTATATPSQLVYNIPTGSVDFSMPITLNNYTQLPPILVTASIEGGKNSYTFDSTDLSNGVFGIVKKEAAIQADAAEQAAEQKVVADTKTRQAAVKQAVIDANTRVKQAASTLQTTSTPQADQLMQNAADALAVVNQLAIKEKRTPEQDNKILEYARLAVLKATEAQNAVKDTVLDYRQTIKQFETKAISMVSKMKQIQSKQPEISLIPRLVQQSEQNLKTITDIRAQVVEKSAEATLLAQATQAYKSIETAYENVSKFESEQVAPIQPTPTPVRGTIRRPGIRG